MKPRAFGGGPEGEDVDAPVALAGEGIHGAGMGDAVAVPGHVPLAGAGLDGRDDRIGDLGVDVAREGSVHGGSPSGSCRRPAPIAAFRRRPKGPGQSGTPHPKGWNTEEDGGSLVCCSARRPIGRGRNRDVRRCGVWRRGPGSPARTGPHGVVISNRKDVAERQFPPETASEEPSTHRQRLAQARVHEPLTARAPAASTCHTNALIFSPMAEKGG